MSGTTKVLLAIGAIVAVGVVIYFVIQRDAPVTAPEGGPSSSAAGIVRSIGAGLTGLVAAITGAVEAEQAASAAGGEAEGAPA